jgi:hypothetical protein
MLSWLAAQGLPERRDRRLVLAAGIAPDLDGLSILGGTAAFERWHHVATHGLAAAVVVTIACATLGRRRLATALVACAAFHLHLLCDLAGSGPGWSIYYLGPWSMREWSWSGSWDLDAWQNQVIGLAAVLACLGAALPLGRTIVEVLSPRVDALVVETVRRRAGWRWPGPP